MKNWWLRLGCFLTGYKYDIVKNSSEASAKTVKKFLAAIVIISILWSFVAFNFAMRYLQASILVSTIVAVIMVIIVIQVERQIILSQSKNFLAFGFRFVIAVVMAIIGSVIIDQIIFKEDVDRQRLMEIQEEVNEILPQKTIDLENRLTALANLIEQKENERVQLIDEVTKKPFIKSFNSESKFHKTSTLDQFGNLKDTLIKKTDISTQEIPNPKSELITKLDGQIKDLRYQETELQNVRLNIREELETEIKQNTGFLVELETLFKILLNSPLALFVWICFFLFFFSLELFVVANKFLDRKNDYDEVVKHQHDTKLKMLAKLSVD